MTTKTEDTRKLRKQRTGIVVSDKMQKSITVAVERRFRHPKYGKFVTKTRKFVVHDEKDTAKAGDRVSIMECRPLSKRKRWRMVDIIEKAK